MTEEHRPPRIRVVEETPGLFCTTCRESADRTIDMGGFSRVCLSCLREALALVRGELDRYERPEFRIEVEPSEATAPPILVGRAPAVTSDEPGAVASGGSLEVGERRVFEGELKNCFAGALGTDNVETPAVEGLLSYFAELENDRKRRNFHGPRLKLRITVDVLDEPSAGKEPAK